MRSFVCFIFLIKLVTAFNETTAEICMDDDALPQPLVEKRGKDTDFRFIGFFDVHEGENCELLIPGGVEQVMMAIGQFENQLILSDLNASEIGFEVYDTCSKTSVALLNLMQALKSSHSVYEECGAIQYTGVIGPLNTTLQRNMQILLEAMKISYFPLQITSLKEEIKALSEVLLDLKWMSVAVFSSTKVLDLEFREEVQKKNICIASSVILSIDSSKSESNLKEKLREISTLNVQVAVVLGSGIDLRKLYETSIAMNSSIQYWLVAGSDSTDSLLSIIFGPDHPVILLRRTPVNIPTVDSRVLSNYKFQEKISRLNPVQSYIDYTNNCVRNGSDTLFDDNRCQSHQFQTRGSLWHIIENSLKGLIIDATQNNATKDEELNNQTTRKISSAKNETKGIPESYAIEIWTFQHAIGRFSKHKELLVGHFSNDHLEWDKKRLNVFHFTGSGWFKIPEFHCRQNCHEICENFENISLATDLENLLSRIYYWKYETWITVLITTSCVGIIISLLTGAYLISRACREDFEEGNQAANVTVLIAVMLSFCCSTLFLLQNDTISCSKRIAIIGLAYVSMLAPILARCFLLIASETDGIHGHISGLLQIILSFFIFAVQVAMACYYWLMNSNESTRLIIRCSIHTKMTICYLSYPIFLSFVWLMTSPFCIRNLRNNKEGLLLHLTSIVVCLAWLMWGLLFFLLNPRWKEFTICLGLVATASAILLGIYLPKVYRMIVFSAARDQGQVSMQPVIFASTSSRSPNPSIYESINHGYNPDKDGYVVDVFRDDFDSPTRKMTHL